MSTTLLPPSPSPDLTAYLEHASARQSSIEKRLIEQHLVGFDEFDIPSNPLDELDVLNHYGFAGKRDMTDKFRVLTVNDHSFGDETLFIAVQLIDTDALIVHYDPCQETLELVRRRAEALQLSDRVRLTGDLDMLLSSLRATSSPEETRRGFGPFDYVRCCNALDRSDNPLELFDTMLAFVKEDGVLGMSCLGYYGREPHRQLQSLAKIVAEEIGNVKQEMMFIRELYNFALPNCWSKLAFENLDAPLRVMADEAMLTDIMREDKFALRLPELHTLLDEHCLHLASFSRHTRAMYQPWFAKRNKELEERFQTLTEKQLAAISEIAWNKIERHIFWATRRDNTRPQYNDPDNIPFFHHFTNRSHGWRRHLLGLKPDKSLEVNAIVAPQEQFQLKSDWNEITHRFVTLIDGYKTLGEIAVMIREESRLGLDEIIETCGRFLKAVEWEDAILIRSRETSFIPFTARQVRTDNEITK